MPTTQSQAASSGQQPGQSSSSTTIEAEIEKVTTVTEEQWKAKKDVLSRKTAEWVIGRSEEQKDVELVVSAIGEETDSRNISSNQPPADAPDERPVSAVAPQVALLAIKAACEKRGCPTEVGQVSLYPPVFKKKPELTEEQIAAMREPNPELPRDFEEFRRVTAKAQDEFSALVDPDMLTEQEVANLTKFGESVEDHFADYDVDPGDTGAASSAAMEIAEGAADEKTEEKTASVDPQ